MFVRWRCHHSAAPERNISLLGTTALCLMTTTNRVFISFFFLFFSFIVVCPSRLWHLRRYSWQHLTIKKGTPFFHACFDSYLTIKTVECAKIKPLSSSSLRGANEPSVPLPDKQCVLMMTSMLPLNTWVIYFLSLSWKASSISDFSSMKTYICVCVTFLYWSSNIDGHNHVLYVLLNWLTHKVHINL